MNCFPCFQSNKEGSNSRNNDLPVAKPKELTPPAPHVENDPAQDPVCSGENYYSSTKNFTFRELAMATKNFRQECLLGEGGFGRIFRGTLQGSGQIVAVRQLDRNGVRGCKDFVIEISKLNLLEHRNLVKLVGYCADGDQRLLVYEYMPLGSLKNHLFDLPVGKKPLDWNTRMKIALGIAEGLEYLHEKIDPPILYRDLKSSNILLDESNIPRLSKYGLANLVQTGNKLHVSPRVMASYGYWAPEYERNGELTSKSDVYSFGLILLELISGRKALDTTRPAEEQNLVNWAQPIFRDQTKFTDMADPLLRKGFSVTSLNQAVGVAAMCLQDEPSARPFISDISAALSFLAMAPPEAPIPDHLVPILSSRVHSGSQLGDNNSFRESGGHEHVSDGEDEDEEMNTDDDYQDKVSSSDYEYDDSDDNSDCEGAIKIACPSKDKFNQSREMGSSSKRKSKKESANRGCLSSKNSKAGFSLRCESTFPDRSNSSIAKQDITQRSHDHSDSSRGDENHEVQRATQ